MDVTKQPYKCIGFGAMDVTKPYKFIRFGAMDATKPYKFIIRESKLEAEQVELVGKRCIAEASLYYPPSSHSPHNAVGPINQRPE